MGRDSRAVYRHLGLIACGAVLVLVTGVALANSVGVTPTGIRYRSTTPTGVNTTATLEARYAGTNANGTRFYNVPVPVSSGTLGSLAQSALRKGARGLGWYGAFQGIVNAAGWAIDELQGQVLDGVPRDQEMMPPGTRVGCYLDFGCSSTRAGAIGMIKARNDFGYVTCRDHATLPPDSDGWWRFQCQAAGWTGWDTVLVATRTLQDWTPDYGTGYEPSPVSPEALGDMIKANPQVINAVLIDPDTGAPIRTPELTQAINDLRKTLEAAGGLDPGPDMQPGNPDETQPYESSWPDFCGWATTVCDFIDWMREEPPTEEKPEVPWDEQPIEQVQWSSGLGGGSCPAPVVVPINFNGHNSTVEFQFEPMCSFATTMRPILIAIAMLLAGFILAGLRENKGA